MFGLSTFKIVEVVGVALVIGAAILFFKLYTNQVALNGSLKQSNTQLSHTIEDKTNATKSRATVEQRNLSVDYPALLDKLRH
jgi:CHASE1-domain containing sensor protein